MVLLKCYFKDGISKNNRNYLKELIQFINPVGTTLRLKIKRYSNFFFSLKKLKIAN
jgi:hypothetical protein